MNRREKWLSREQKKVYKKFKMVERNWPHKIGTMETQMIKRNKLLTKMGQ